MDNHYLAIQGLPHFVKVMQILRQISVGTSHIVERFPLEQFLLESPCKNLCVNNLPVKRFPVKLPCKIQIESNVKLPCKIPCKFPC